MATLYGIAGGKIECVTGVHRGVQIDSTDAYSIDRFARYCGLGRPGATPSLRVLDPASVSRAIQSLNTGRFSDVT